MRVVVQRVLKSSVKVDGKLVGSIERGVNLLIGFCIDDTEEDINYIKDKVVNLRIFEDENDKLNKSLIDINGEILAISQFTLYGDCRKGRRPNFMEAMPGKEAKALYLSFVQKLRDTGLKVEMGIFGADMKVDILNDGPVTILIDSSKKF